MNTEVEKRMADRILQTLSRARYLDRTTALRTIAPMRDETGYGGAVEHERGQAWLAICALYKALSELPASADIQEPWQKAIDKTEAWLATLK